MTLAVGQYACTGTGVFERIDAGFTYVTSLAGGTSADSGQATVIASATPHAVGSWTDVVTAASAAAAGIIVTLRSNAGVTATDTSTLLDVGIDASGGTTFSTLVTSVPVGYRALGHPITLPCPIPSGSRVAVRLRSLVASKSLDVTASLFAGPSLTAPTTIGADTANSRGTVLSSSAGPTSLSTWTNIGSTTAAAYRALFVGIQGGGDSVMATGGVRVDIGVSSTIVGTTFWHTLGTELIYPTSPVLVVPATPIASGSQIQARWAGPSANGLDVIVHAYT